MFASVDVWSIRLKCAAALAMAIAQSCPAAEPLLLRIHSGDPKDPWPLRIDAEGPSNGVYYLDSGPIAGQWANRAVTLDSLKQYPAVTGEGDRLQFYRVRFGAKNETNDWKNQIHFPIDPFTSADRSNIPNDIQWIKFAVVWNDPIRVYYQDSRQYLFHYDWATLRLEPFQGMSRLEFDRASLFLDGQQILLGAVLYPPWPNDAEYGIQLAGQDPYPPEWVARVIKLVEATVAAPNGVRAFYMPTFEQNQSAKQQADQLAALGVRLSSVDRWIQGDQCYAPGWAFGRLVYITASDIDAAYTDGRLNPVDILLTDDLPAEIPFLAGVLTLTPATPNSHVAILARSYGIPFAHVVDPIEQARILALAGRKVGVRVETGFESCTVRVLDVIEEFPPALEEEILALKEPAPLQITPKERLGRYSASTDTLTRDDLKYFGGKASHYGYLRRAIPAHADAAVAFSFDLWDDFMDQLMPGGLPLRDEISNRLAPYSYPPDIAALRGDLADIREMITITAAFPVALRQVVTNALAVFDPARKIRVRSSTNVEDTDQFVGAGLYDSFSGCLWDDLDEDTQGPSHCDPDEANERGVFRAIQKVYASFYNDNAFLERLRFGLDESEVGMALLVHHSFPDDLEWANGVATLEVNLQGAATQLTGDLVTQEGAHPVTNPTGGALPEVVHAYRYGSTTYLNLSQRSSLIPLGEFVLDWEEDYRTFVTLFAAVAEAFRSAVPEKQRFILDFEYKEVAPGDLVVKQVRELPRNTATASIAPFLLQVSNCFGVFQGEFGDVMSNHRLKSLWHFTTENLRLTSTNLDHTFFANIVLEYLDEAELRTLSGSPASWTEAAYTASVEFTTNAWTMGSGKASNRYHLITTLVRNVPANGNPLLTLSDMDLWWSVDYGEPRAGLDYMGQPVLVTNEIVRLALCPVVRSDSLKQTRQITNETVTVDTTFYWPKEPTGAIAGYTAPLIGWEQTTIRGLTQQPIVLTGSYSQTYRPGHHNFTEEFVFEPRLEPGIDAGILGELEAKNIRLIHVRAGWLGDPIRILGFDDQWRQMPSKSMQSNAWTK